MANKTLTGFLLLVFAVELSGCDKARAPGPTAPSAPPAAPTAPTAPTAQPGPAFLIADVTISGVVYEVTPAGEVPIEGVRIANGGGAPVLTETDGNGFFSFRPVRVCPCWSSPSIPAGTTLLFIEKNGYDDPPGLPESAFRPHGPGFRDVMIDGDTRVRIQLVRR
jgi:hypothetical protein